uniref:Phytoene dehydrogenase n=1 Tax=Streptomyces antibioticus TaxID=1890 RepID=A0A1S5RMQ6_STRAT|nr:phytoene dehydrogenase [Streptomyces antibioticus]
MTDAAIVGTGPNGLAASVTLARAGLKASLHERADTVGGGLRTTALFDSEVRHDVCFAVHPMAAASAFFRRFDLPARGVRLLPPEVPYAHPLPGGRATAAWRDLARTASRLGADGPRCERLVRPLVSRSTAVVDLVLGSQRALARADHPAGVHLTGAGPRHAPQPVHDSAGQGLADRGCRARRRQASLCGLHGGGTAAGPQRARRHGAHRAPRP